jgi:hypothetical protein
VHRQSETRRVTETMYIYLDNDMSFIPALSSVSSSAGVSSAKSMQMIPSSRPYCNFFLLEQNRLLAFVRVCTGICKYVLVHYSDYTT